MPLGSQHAHQIINTADEPLIYLCISTMIEPEVTMYPDSKKIGVMTGTAPDGRKSENSFKAFYRKESGADYFDGEK